MSTLKMTVARFVLAALALAMLYGYYAQHVSAFYPLILATCLVLGVIGLTRLRWAVLATAITLTLVVPVSVTYFP
jgi:hypothetical protein